MNHIPDLSQVGLTAEQKAKRRTFLGGSDANILIHGSPEDVTDLWRAKRGEVEDDLGAFNLQALMGQWTEPLHVAWFMHQTGRTVTENGVQKRSERFPWMGCTLDGLTTAANGKSASLQCKHLNEWLKRDDLRLKYIPQLTHEAIVCGTPYAILSVIQGSATWWFEEFEVDPLFAQQLIDTERRFWECVQNGTPPHPIEKVEVAADRPFAFRTVDMSQGNQAPEWGALAGQWIEEEPFVRRRKQTDAALKGMLMDDVGVATGSGITITRNKAGSLAITQTDQPKRRRA